VPGKPKKCAPEFKDQAARKVVDNSLPIVQVARELGINESTLGFWVQDYRRKLAGQPLPAERSHASCATHAGPRRSPKRHPATGYFSFSSSRSTSSHGAGSPRTRRVTQTASSRNSSGLEPMRP